MGYNKTRKMIGDIAMCPIEILPGIDLYVVFLTLGVIAAIVTFSKMSDVVKLNARLHNFCLYTAIAAVVLGYGSAVLFQAFYNIAKLGKFEINKSTGATFYGGLIGGATVFLAIYFIAGHFIFKDKSNKQRFFDVSDCVAPAIAIAHSLGRIGCLMAGCCHGAVTDKWYGIHMVLLQKKVVPTQLFESIFLFCLFLFFVIRIKKGRSYNLPLYMIIYGVWRFFIEYLRNDYRGTTFVSALTPSQLTAVFMIVGGIALIFVFKYLKSRLKDVKEEPSEVNLNE